jgi:TonB family protein
VVGVVFLPAIFFLLRDASLCLKTFACLLISKILRANARMLTLLLIVEVVSMKKNAFLVIASFMALTALPLCGQAQSHRRVTKNFEYDKRGKTYDLRVGDLLTVVINNAGDSGVVVLNPAAPSDTTGDLIVKAWAIQYSPGASSVMPNSITPIPDNHMVFNNQRLLVDGNWSPDKRVVVHLTLPSTTRVALSVNGKLLRDGLVAKGLIARGDEMIEGGKGGIGTSEQMAILQALHVGIINGKTPPLDPEAINPAAKIGGDQAVPWRVLKTYAIAPIAADYPPAQNSNGFATVGITVDQNGVVTKAERKTGDEALGRAVAQALKQWRFRPFLINGQPVIVRSIVTVRPVGGKATF